MSFGYSIRSVNAIKAIPQTVLNELVATRGVPSLIVEEKNRWYTYNPISIEVGNDNTVITPNSNIGRWLAHTSGVEQAIEIGIQDDGVVVGKANTLNFIGANLNVVVNNKSAEISVVGGTGGGGGGSGGNWTTIFGNLTEWQTIYLG